MLCPRCATSVPEGGRFCPKCGQDMAAAPDPTAVTPPAPQAAPAPAYAPPPPQPAFQAQAPQPQAAYPPQAAYAPQAGSAPAGYAADTPPKKKRTGLVIAIASLCLLVLCCCVPLAVLAIVPAFRDRITTAMNTSPSATTDVSGSGAGGAATQPASNAEDQAAIEAARATVERYYAAYAAADLEAIRATLVPEIRADLTADWFEGGPQTSFEFTRGVSDGTNVVVYGRESERAFGSGGDGGVKFRLTKSGDEWLIATWAGADRTQIDGMDTSGSSSGMPGPLTQQSASEIVSQLLNARMAGNANGVRQLTTPKFQDAYGNIWLDGSDQSEFFTAYRITSANIDGETAVVTSAEDWNSGTEEGSYKVVVQDGVLLVDTWNE